MMKLLHKFRPPPPSRKFWKRSFLWQKNFQVFCNAFIKHSPYIVKLEMTFRFVHINVYMPIFKINKKTVAWFLCDSNSPQIFSQKDNFFQLRFHLPFLCSPPPHPPTGADGWGGIPKAVLCLRKNRNVFGGVGTYACPM